MWDLVIKVFVSYAREDASAVADLVEVIHGLGHEPWMDRELRGGQVWWEEILAQLRGCDLFICAVSPSSCASTACIRELIYADALGKTILPVMIHPVVSMATLPPQLASRQILEFRPQDASAVMRLARALHEAPPSTVLPDHLPEPPEAPLSYLGKLGLDLGRDELSLAEQSQILLELKAAMADPISRGGVLTLLETFRRRPDLFARIEREIESILEQVDQGRDRARSIQEGPAAKAWMALTAPIGGTSAPKGTTNSPRSSSPIRWRAPILFGAKLGAANFLAFLIIFSAMGAINEPEIIFFLPLSLLAGIGGCYGVRNSAKISGLAYFLGVGGGVLGFFIGLAIASSLTNDDAAATFLVFASQALTIYVVLASWSLKVGSRTAHRR